MFVHSSLFSSLLSLKCHCCCSLSCVCVVVALPPTHVVVVVVVVHVPLLLSLSLSPLFMCHYCYLYLSLLHSCATIALFVSLLCSCPIVSSVHGGLFSISSHRSSAIAPTPSLLLSCPTRHRSRPFPVSMFSLLPSLFHSLFVCAFWFPSTSLCWCFLWVWCDGKILLIVNLMNLVRNCFW